MKFASSFIYITLILFLLLQIASADEVIEKSFSVSQGGWLKLESDLGSIEVESHSSNSVEVKVIKKVRNNFSRYGKELLDKFEVRFEQKGNDVYVVGELEGWNSDKGSYLNIHYIINVPKEYNLDLHTSGGSISVGDLKGQVISKTSGGSLEFGSILGPISGKTSGGSISVGNCTENSELKTSGGSISVGNAEGNIDANTSGGSITIESAKGDVDATTSGGSCDINEVMGNINAKTSGGHIKCHITNQPTDDCSLKTSGGSVTVHFDKDTAVDIDASTSGGHVTCEHEITIKGKIEKSALKGKINGGGPTLNLKTSGGSIRILDI
jgi:hypothetical protein